MQIDLVGQPGVNGAPVSSLGFLVVPLLDHTQAFSLFPVERADTVHRVIASVNAPVVARPLFWRYVVISHKNKESPQLSPRTLSVPPLLSVRKASLDLMETIVHCSGKRRYTASLAD